MRNAKAFLTSLSLVIFLCSCGDEITTLTESQGNGVQNVAANDSLPICDSSNLGKIIFVQKSASLMFCGDEGWSSLKGTDGENGSEGELGEVHKSVDTIFVNRVDTVFVDVRDTVLIVDSVFGIPGVGCNSEPIEGGHKIVCNGDSVGVVFDGRDGNVGSIGNDGKGSCEVIDDFEGTMTISCGVGDDVKLSNLYKALCDNVPYDPNNKVCVDLGLLPLCNEKNEGAIIENTNGSLYTCREKNWTVASKMEISIGKGCSGVNQGESVLLDYSYWVCRADSIGWVYDFEHLNRGTVTYSGKTYKTIGIGSQMWMAENLNYADSAKTPNLKGNSWCSNKVNSNCSIYGRLYTWTAAMNVSSTYLKSQASSVVIHPHKGICPDGWHIPNWNEFMTLISFVDENNGSEGIATSLKSASYWKAYSGVPKGSDRFGFSALPAGISNDNAMLGARLYLWSSTEGKSSEYNVNGYLAARDFSSLKYEDSGVSNYGTGLGDRRWGRSVRCLKN